MDNSDPFYFCHTDSAWAVAGDNASASTMASVGAIRNFGGYQRTRFFPR
ncbi:hypothetical protein JQC72_09935 [Polycladomyces sp. WAk]|uniref:Uncharacterized protein n=1 Tax=Polycladomyces zharkentensis TaxID=2807616 RepID=A0ABS2WK01_9BACL|nr:hypothetical protein [Polycladomyces sp. WAk]MBN2909843.1 hypothetical protein [Polycladomyces sp. WAk]